MTNSLSKPSTGRQGDDGPRHEIPVHRSGAVWDRVSHLVSVHGLLLLVVVFIVVFSVWMPDTFPTMANLRSVVSVRSVTALLAFAVMIPLAAGHFDLSIGYTLGLTHVIVIGVQVRNGLSWEVAVLVALGVGVLVGLVNGLLVTVAQIDSFIATLAVGTFVFGLANWYTDGTQLQGQLGEGFIQLTAHQVLGIPVAAFYVLGIAVLLWVLLEFLPSGRHLYVLGANPRAAELVGIRVRPYVILAFVGSGLLAACGGILFASQLRVGQSTVGPEFLLPAFVGALLGATSVRPGRVNVWGTVVAVLLLAVGIAGLQQLGAAFFVEPIFNGATLAIAVGVAGFAARRRARGRIASG